MPNKILPDPVEEIGVIELFRTVIADPWIKLIPLFWLEDDPTEFSELTEKLLPSISMLTELPSTEQPIDLARPCQLNALILFFRT
jgi:hypothetical protein